MKENDIGTKILSAAIAVHRELDPGLLESVYEEVLLELKSVEKVTPSHKKLIQTYVNLSGLKLGYLLNFGDAVLKNGITRCVNGLQENFSAPPRLRAKISRSNFT